MRNLTQSATYLHCPDPPLDEGYSRRCQEGARLWLHPFWDVVLHYIGPGHAFTPWAYAIACVSFDWIVAIYIVVAYGLVGSRRLGFREVATT